MSDNDVDKAATPEPDRDAAEPAEGAGATTGSAATSAGKDATDDKAVTLDKTEPAAARDSADDPGTAAAAPGFAAKLRWPAGRARTVTAGAAVAVLVGASVGAAGWFSSQNSEHEGLLAAHEEARQAACAYAPVLADYDAKNLDAYFAKVLDGATGDWRKQFDDTSRELREVLTQGEVVSKADDVQCAIKTGDETSAEAIVVIGQTITSVGTQGKPSPGQLSMIMRMEKTDGRWLVNHVNSPLASVPQQ
ncbi:hypothetical protein CJ469_02568 [Nocardia farcinica]|uniref:hypothetical protein n=1 Tax=Nocardia farcinica TaxID=37329 RepID=UPI000C00822E|nr:hypothetical protein [Nocardia farcinica]PFX03047.1 hypothetical protein CJ469_02568 [Nocardia farcinica]PFX07932.1 hypothetical protein CJ468_03096 [Nocardia farcinica]